MRHPGQLSPGRPGASHQLVERRPGRPSRPSPLALRRARSPRPQGTRATAPPRHEHSGPGGRQHARERLSHPQPPSDQGPQAPVVATPAQASATEAHQQRSPQDRLTHALLRWCHVDLRRRLAIMRRAPDLPCRKLRQRTGKGNAGEAEPRLPSAARNSPTIPKSPAYGWTAVPRHTGGGMRRSESADLLGRRPSRTAGARAA